MSKARRKRSQHADLSVPSRRSRSRWLPFGIVGAVIVLAGIAVATRLVSRGSAPDQVAWAHLGTSDVHSLAFWGDDTTHVLFGHHGGISESRDGGRSWHPLPTTDDAMGMRPAGDGSIVIAGHDVLSASRDGGKTWQPIASDLPSLDIHGFARDPGDPARMWAALAVGGLWESADYGAHWTRVRADNVVSLFAVRTGATTQLLALDMTGLIASADGGRSWRPLVTPPTYPMTALAATPDGRIIYAGSLNGLYRSGDSGNTWVATTYTGSAFAIATSADGSTVAVVSRQTDFFRSSDGGQTWLGPG